MTDAPDIARRSVREVLQNLLEDVAAVCDGRASFTYRSIINYSSPVGEDGVLTPYDSRWDAFHDMDWDELPLIAFPISPRSYVTDDRAVAYATARSKGVPVEELALLFVTPSWFDFNLQAFLSYCGDDAKSIEDSTLGGIALHASPMDELQDAELDLPILYHGKKILLAIGTLPDSGTDPIGIVFASGNSCVEIESWTNDEDVDYVTHLVAEHLLKDPTS